MAIIGQNTAIRMFLFKIGRNLQRCRLAGSVLDSKRTCRRHIKHIIAEAKQDRILARVETSLWK
jgi:hypothetical protein